jgi:predicted nucleic acid-binding protein
VILLSLARLPDGRRKQNLQQCWDALMAELFAGRVWSFTSEAAHWYAELLRHRERLGRSMATADAVIAATALAQGASLATRDWADFADIGLELINPWHTP